MSSVVAFLRALVMLACLLAVPALALSHGSTISRGLQAAARFLDRVSAAPEADPPVTSEALRSARPTPGTASGNPLAVAHPGEGHTRRMLPEPVEDTDASRRVALVMPERDNSASLASQVHGEPEPGEESVPKEDPHVADWEEMAAALQELGAVEYALERWGVTGDLYRFRCLAAVDGAAAYQRHFQAVDGHGGRAVERVVQQVRAWRSGTPGSGGGR